MEHEKNAVRLSKFLSLVLRHRPEALGITLDDNGWTDANQLVVQLRDKGWPADRAVLDRLVSDNPKKRFAYNESGDKIRASQGHSVAVTLGYSAKEPPAMLYHGTGQQSVPGILTVGIEKRKRHHVHLSPDIPTALNVGRRHGQPAVFIVKALEMYRLQYTFFLSDNGVWLTDYVPPGFLEQYNGTAT